MQNATLEADLRIFFSRRCEFYTYPGSITTPTCHESVRWVIMRDPIMVTERAVRPNFVKFKGKNL
ncbi:MAG: carbonic anhydrase family protein [Candidatus Thiodiazotropha sp.]